MKQILLSLLACGMFASVFAQPDPGTPCCNIIARDIQKNLVIARDNTTGRLYHFKADARDMTAIKLNDAVNISAGKVTSIGGAKRTYVPVRAYPGTPCCGVVNIQPDPAVPCCNVVSFKNNTTNKTYNISVPKQVAATLKTGQAVTMDGATGMAIVQSSYGSSNGQMNSFGYAATSGDNTNTNKGDNTNTNKGTSTDKWVITPVTNMKGVLGKLDMNFPAGTDWNIWIYTQADDQFVNSFYQTHNTKSYNLSPGEYSIKLGNVTVENVPIQKGHETRLKAGFLNVVSEGSWALEDETKEKFISSNNVPQKIALPVGSYQLKLGGNYYPVVIKDGQTVEY